MEICSSAREMHSLCCMATNQDAKGHTQVWSLTTERELRRANSVGSPLLTGNASCWLLALFPTFLVAFTGDFGFAGNHK